ncbi:MAG: hypothetical protein KAR07_11435 [Spirochaetes bacterium]|nr:hypothetical protein [Spirochaetota bacterium]
MDYLLWIPTRVHSYLEDKPNEDYVRSWWPRISGDCEDLVLVVFDCYYGLLNNIMRDTYWIKLGLKIDEYYPCFTISSTNGFSYMDDEDVSTTKKNGTYYMHASVLFIHKKSFKRLVALNSKNVNIKRKKETTTTQRKVILGEATSIVVQSLNSTLKTNKTITSKLEHKDNGFRYAKTGTSFYKKVYQLICPDFYEDFEGIISFTLSYKGSPGVPIKKFLNFDSKIKVIPHIVTTAARQMRYGKKLNNHPIPYKDFWYFGDTDKPDRRYNEAREFINKVSSAYNNEKLEAVMFCNVNDLLNENVQKKVLRLKKRKNIKFNFIEQDIYPDSQYNKMRTYLCLSWKGN